MTALLLSNHCFNVSKTLIICVNHQTFDQIGPSFSCDCLSVPTSPAGTHPITYKSVYFHLSSLNFLELINLLFY